MGKLIIRRGLFVRKQLLAPTLPRLVGIVLRDVSPAEPIYKQLEEDLKTALYNPKFPDILLTDAQFLRLELHALEMDKWTQTKRVEAVFSACYHMRACLAFDPYALPSLQGYLADAKRRAFLTVALGMLAIAWQIKNGQELVLSLADFNRAHPDLADRWRRPR
jgi:hypothetical protein